MNSPIRCADVIAKLFDQYVIIERLSTPCGLALPGGKIDAGESEERAAVREFFEETGMAVVLEGRVGHYDSPGRDPRGAYVSTVFHGSATGVPKAEAGKTKVHLLTRSEIESRLSEFVADHATVLREYLCKNL